jgi:predicted pyridoxine 5'-phosphate oxidase superfamily flavin-nucleotide-binding protein
VEQAQDGRGTPTTSLHPTRDDHGSRKRRRRPVSALPFHPGELEAQASAGGGPPGSGIRGFLLEQQRAFFEALPYVLAGAVDHGWPAATLFAGPPGFISAPDASTLVIAARLDPEDPAQRSLVPGSPAALLGIDLAARRRNRANGIVAQAAPDGFALEVQQAFGNCPQYIHVRHFKPFPGGAGETKALTRLDREDREAIARADTFFVASAARTGDPRAGADISHRGGPPGFVRVEGDTLTVPDFSGNRYFNTLGNLVSNPRAALLFVDFASGGLLHVQGTTEIVWEGPEVGALDGAERLWRVRVERGWRKRSP